MYRILRIDLEPGENEPSASSTLDRILYEDGLEVVGTSTYLDTMNVTATPKLVVVCREIVWPNSKLTPDHLKAHDAEVQASTADDFRANLPA